MTNGNLPTNVFTLRQSEFQAIPGNPWGYWVPLSIISIFISSSRSNRKVFAKRGISPVDIFRYLRFGWETPDGVKWKKSVHGGGRQQYYGQYHFVFNWGNNGAEMKADVIHRYPYLGGNYGWLIRDEDWFGKPGLTYSRVAGQFFAVRLLPENTLFDDAGPAIYGEGIKDLELLGIFNSSLALYLIKLINPTINIQKGDIEKIPLPRGDLTHIGELAKKQVYLMELLETQKEGSDKFIMPECIINHPLNLIMVWNIFKRQQVDIDNQTLEAYGVPQQDFQIVQDFFVSEDQNEVMDEDESGNIQLDGPSINRTLWIMYAIGIILGRFQPGTPGALGSAVYRCSDFAIGSLPEPTEEEFTELVGEPPQFAYIDEQGGRHVFSHQVEQALQKLAVPDGIAVFDPNHPRDLPSLVSKALELMLGEQGAAEVIAALDQGRKTNGGRPSSIVFRQFLEKDFFTQLHIKQYRKRPAYWPIQSSKRSFGFVLFHEKIDCNTFYALQQEPYLPTKRRAVQLRLEELGKKVLTAQGAARKPIEKEMDELRQLAEELAQFAKDLDAITRSGYEPEADWIDDGVILRMAPLWSVIPLWKSEPKKYWDELAAGKYDWSRIAMKYWPERVKQACKKNKSFAIAHGHEEWYKGG